MKPGDLVSVHDTQGGEMFGIILHIRPMEGCFRDSSGNDQVNLCYVLMNQPLPAWMGNGNIAELYDSVLQVINETR